MEKTKHQLNLLYLEGSYESKSKVPFLFSRSFLNVQCTHVYGSKHHCDSCKIWLSIAGDDCIVEFTLCRHICRWQDQHDTGSVLPQLHRSNDCGRELCVSDGVRLPLASLEAALHTPLHIAYESCLQNLHDRCVVWQATYLLMSSGVDSKWQQWHWWWSWMIQSSSAEWN